MTEKKSKLSWAIDIVMLLIFVVLIFKPVKWEKIEGRPIDEGTYDYCVEWDYRIDRSTLVHQCYNFVKQEIMCDFRIEGEQEIFFYSRVDPNKVLANYQCTRYIKSIEVEPEEVEPVLSTLEELQEELDREGLPIDDIIFGDEDDNASSE